MKLTNSLYPSLPLPPPVSLALAVNFVINIKRTYLFRLCLRKNLSFEPSLLIIYAAMFHICSSNWFMAPATKHRTHTYTLPPSLFSVWHTYIYQTPWHVTCLALSVLAISSGDWRRAALAKTKAHWKTNPKLANLLKFGNLDFNSIYIFQMVSQLGVDTL